MFLYPDTSVHLRVFNEMVEQPVLFVHAAQREAVKAIAFAGLYGMGPQKMTSLSKKLKL